MRKFALIAFSFVLALAVLGCGDNASSEPGKTMDEKRNDMGAAPAPGAGGNAPENAPKTEGM